MMKSAVFGVVAILSCSLVAQSLPDSAKPAQPGKIYHVGGDVKAPRAISSPRPIVDNTSEKSTGTAKKVNDVGSTILSIVVGTDGSVWKAKVLRGLRPDLDAKAVEAVKQWRFEPATKKGVPVPVELDVQVDFHLYK